MSPVETNPARILLEEARKHRRKKELLATIAEIATPTSEGYLVPKELFEQFKEAVKPVD